MKRQEVIDYIDEEFSVCPEQLWASFPNYLVFRNAKNKKWFGIMMDIESEKLGLGGSEKRIFLLLKATLFSSVRLFIIKAIFPPII